jgi:hypothetical protein
MLFCDPHLSKERLQTEFWVVRSSELIRAVVVLFTFNNKMYFLIAARNFSPADLPVVVGSGRGVARNPK